MKTTLKRRIESLTWAVVLGVGISNLSGPCALGASTNCISAPPGLVAWWQAEGDTLDAAGANTGTFQNGSAFSTGEVGQAFNFNGTNQYVDVANAANLNPTSALTVEAWIYPRVPFGSVAAPIIKKAGESTAQQDGYTLEIASASGLMFGVYVNGGRGWVLTAPISVASNQWSHVAGVFDGTNVSIYVNGALVGTPVSAPGQIVPSGNHLQIGHDPSNPSRYFNGRIDEASVYSAALSAAQIQAIYNAGTAGKCTTPTAPVILTQPTDQTVATGSGATFSVAAAGTLPLSYQWSFNGSALTDATNASLILSGVTTNQAGVYSVLVTNLYGATVSSNASLTVLTLAAGLFDDFDPGIDAVQWSGFGGGFLATNYGGFVSGPNSLWFGGTGSRFAATRPLDTTSGGNIQFYLRIASGMSSTWETADLPGEGIVLEYSVGSTSNWVQIGRYDTSTYLSWTQISVPIPAGAQAPSAQFRWRQLSNSGTGYDHWALDDVLIATGPTPPAIATQPKSQTVPVGTNVNLTVVATGTSPLSYQWRWNGTNIGTATGSALAITNVQLADAGSYDVLVSNAYGSTNSATAMLTVLDPPQITVQPQDQTVVVGADAAFAVTATGGTPLTYQWYFNGTRLASATTSGLQLTGVSSGLAGIYSVTVSNSAGRVSSRNASLVILGNGSCVVPPSGLVSWWQAEGNGGDAKGANGGVTHGNLTFLAGEVGQAFSFDGSSAYVSIPASASLNVGTNAGFAIEGWIRPASASANAAVFEWDNGQGTAGVHLWISQPPPYGSGAGCIYVNLIDTTTAFHTLTTTNGVINASGFQHVALTYDKSSGVTCLYYNGALVASQALGTFTPQTSYGLYFGERPTSSVSMYQGLMDEVGLYGRALSAQEIQAIYGAGSVGRCGLPPIVVTQPKSQTVSAGTNVNFTVVATGTSPLSYQWRLDGTNIATATGAALAITNVQLADAGSYDVLVSNVYGSTNSATATLTVLAPPQITVQPQDQTVVAGTDATFTVTATGSTPLFYQWYFNGTRLAPATASSLQLSGVSSSLAGIYSVTISNSAGKVTSRNASLVVLGSGSCVVSPSGLVGWWQGEGNASDSTGTNNGVVEGSAGFAGGEVGQAFSFDGTNGDVRVAASSSLNVGAGGGLTVEAWINPAEVTQPHPLVEWNNGSFGVHLWIGVPVAYSGGGPGSLHLDLKDIAFNDHYFHTAAGLIVSNTWQHVAATYNKADGTTALYVNGAMVTQMNIGIFTPMTTGDLYFALRPFDGGAGTRYAGQMDEVGIYKRALSAAEIQAIYNSGNIGRCGLSPVIVSGPQSQTVLVGGNANFNVTASGTPPFNYQWQFNGTNLSGATSAALSLANAQQTQAGSYSVLVANAHGSAASSNATLTVNVPPPCVPPPAGLISWWRGEGDATDQLGANPGNLQNGTNFVSGEVGQAFDFNGTSQYVDVPSNSNLDPTSSITLEAWVYPRPPFNSESSPVIKKAGEGLAQQDGYALELTGSGAALFGVYVSGGRGWVQPAAAPLTANQWSHVAGVYNGTNLSIYVNGVLAATPVSAPGQIVPSGNHLQIGHDPSNPWRYFNGRVDEPSVYSTALSVAQIQAIYAAGPGGKCATAIAPSILVQPASQTATVGASVTFSVVASGTLPLNYQWNFQGTNIPGATGPSMTLSSVQISQSGNYSVLVTNGGGSILSSNALLTVNLPPANIRVASISNAPAGGSVIVPVVMTANGNENGMGFSLNFDPAKLIYGSTAAGSGATGAQLLLNSAQAASGKLGVLLVLPPDTTFSPGTQEVVRVTFTTALVTNAATTTLSFGDVPVTRQLSDVAGSLLPATYTGGSVSIQAADFEGDLAPRPDGDKLVTVTDWVLAGRFAARLEFPTNTGEFQRVDCAPRSTVGDGAITVSDWVQVGRYAAGLDPLAAAGGPSVEVPPAMISLQGTDQAGGKDSALRQVIVSDAVLIQGLTGTVYINLKAQGNENALGFSLAFDPAVLSYTGASLGSGASGAAFYLNSSQANSGHLGFVLALGTGSNFPAGTREVVKVGFRALTPASDGSIVSLTTEPVPFEVSDTTARRLAAGTVNGTITVNPLPSLKICCSDQSVTLSWPLWATNFGLQTADSATAGASGWSNLVITPTPTNNENVVIVSPVGASKFYRLIHP